MPTLVGFSIPHEHCQPAQVVKFTGELLISSSNPTFGIWRCTSHDASNITPYTNRDPIRFRYDPNMNNWDLCGLSNCLNLHSLTLLKGGRLFNGMNFHINWSAKMWLGQPPWMWPLAVRLAGKPPQTVSNLPVSFWSLIPPLSDTALTTLMRNVSWPPARWGIHQWLSW